MCTSKEQRGTGAARSIPGSLRSVEGGIEIGEVGIDIREAGIDAGEVAIGKRAPGIENFEAGRYDPGR